MLLPCPTFIARHVVGFRQFGRYSFVVWVDLSMKLFFVVVVVIIALFYCWFLLLISLGA